MVVPKKPSASPASSTMPQDLQQSRTRAAVQRFQTRMQNQNSQNSNSNIGGQNKKNSNVNQGTGTAAPAQRQAAQATSTSRIRQPVARARSSSFRTVHGQQGTGKNNTPATAAAPVTTVKETISSVENQEHISAHSPPPSTKMEVENDENDEEFELSSPSKSASATSGVKPCDVAKEVSDVKAILQQFLAKALDGNEPYQNTSNINNINSNIDQHRNGNGFPNWDRLGEILEPTKKTESYSTESVAATTTATGERTQVKSNLMDVDGHYKAIEQQPRDSVELLEHNVQQQQEKLQRDLQLLHSRKKQQSLNQIKAKVSRAVEQRRNTFEIQLGEELTTWFGELDNTFAASKQRSQDALHSIDATIEKLKQEREIVLERERVLCMKYGSCRETLLAEAGRRRAEFEKQLRSRLKSEFSAIGIEGGIEGITCGGGITSVGGGIAIGSSGSSGASGTSRCGGGKEMVMEVDDLHENVDPTVPLFAGQLSEMVKNYRKLGGGKDG